MDGVGDRRTCLRGGGRGLGQDFLDFHDSRLPTAVRTVMRQTLDPHLAEPFQGLVLGRDNVGNRWACMHVEAFYTESATALNADSEA